MTAMKFSSKLLIIVSLLTVQRNDATPSQVCSGNTFVVRGNKEYRLFNEKVTCAEAQVRCQNWGAEWGNMEGSGGLATVLDEDTQSCLTQMIETPGNYVADDWPEDYSEFDQGYFVGGIDYENEGHWLWQDGRPIPMRSNDGEVAGYQNWAQYEPNNRDNEDCMTMLITQVPYYSDYSPGKWIDQKCNIPQFYICEREIPRDLNWGFNNNPHSLTPDRWSEQYETCDQSRDGSRQSPVDINIFAGGRCNDGLSVVASWESDFDNVEWIVHNNGRTIEIEPNPANSTYTLFQGSDERHYVDKVHLKWGPDNLSGSEHTISGIRYAAELQIFHHPTQVGGERHALAFLIQKQMTPTNRRWSELIRSIAMSQELGMSYRMASPTNHFKHLLGDTAISRSHRSESYIMEVGIRYRGSLPTPPCTEDIIWTVYPRPITLSHTQFSILRHIHMEGGQFMHGNTRPTQARRSPHCLVNY